MASSSLSSIKTIYYRKKRYISFGIITFIALLLPMIRINGNHIFLLSFDKKQLHLFFTAFDMQELYLMPFVLMLLFLSIFFMTALGGRVWCGWSCPQTIFRVIYRDLIETALLGIHKNIKNKQKEAASGAVLKKGIAILLWSMLSLLAASNFLWYFIPPEDFFTYLKDPFENSVMYGFLIGIALFLIYDIVFLKEDFCIYICPYARIQSVLFDNHTIQTIYDEKRGGQIFDANGLKLSAKPPLPNDDCTGCEACVRVCPTHIDIRKGMQLECINCLECADACTPVMEKLGKPSLITWTSSNALDSKTPTKFLRFRTVAYGVVLVLVLIALFVMGSKKETMLLNINRPSQLYTILEDHKTIENAYVFLFQNTDSKDHEFYFEVLHKDILIERPSEPFLLKAGEKIKKIVLLNALAKELNKEGEALPIDIKAYAVDNKEHINVLRHTVFVFPPASELK